MFSIILKPIVNEKSVELIKKNFYTFAVDKRSTKKQISKVVAEKFSVDVIAVKTVSLPAKRKMQRARRGYFEVSGTKKAIVQLKKGQKIALFEAPAEEKEVEVRTVEGEPVVKEKKSLLSGTKVRIEKESAKKEKTSKKGDK